MQGLLQGQMAGRCTARPMASSFQGQALQCKISRQGRGTRRATVAKQAAYDPIAPAYANALVELAEEKKLLNEIHSDVDTLRSLLEENASFRDFLYNPVVSSEKKRGLIEKVQKEAGLQEYTANFINLIMDRQRIEALENIFEAFEIEYCNRTDTKVATLKSAVKLEQEQQFLIAKKLQELTGAKNIKLKPIVDESLIAGFVVEYGSAQIDLSVKGKLDRISLEMQGA